MPRGTNRAATGGRFAAVPEAERRVLVAMRLPRASVDALARLQTLSGDSQANIVAAALEAYERACARPKRKRVHAVVA